jgi:hypothetical protein
MSQLGYCVSAISIQAQSTTMILTMLRYIEENHASKVADIKSQRDNSRNNNRRGPSQEMMQYWGKAHSPTTSRYDADLKIRLQIRGRVIVE